MANGCNTASFEPERLNTLQLPISADEECVEKPSPVTVQPSFPHDFTVPRIEVDLPLVLNSLRNTTVEVVLEPQGLDQRFATRSLGLFSLTTSRSRTINVPMDKLPLTSTTHAVRSTVAIVLDSGRGDTIRTPYFWHFSSSTGRVRVFDTNGLITSYNGGLIGTDPFLIDGSVWDGTRYVSVQDARRLESTDMADVAGTTVGVVDWVNNPLANPTLPPGYIEAGNGPNTFPVCADWDTDYIDAGPQDDFNDYQTDASYAQYVLGRGAACSQGPQTAGCTVLQQGFLSRDGCTGFVPPAYGEGYFLWVYSNIFRGDDPSDFAPQPTVAESPGHATIYVLDHDSTGQEIGARGYGLSFYVPPYPNNTPLPNFADLLTPADEVTNAAAIASASLRLVLPA